MCFTKTEFAYARTLMYLDWYSVRRSKSDWKPTYKTWFRWNLLPNRLKITSQPARKFMTCLHWTIVRSPMQAWYSNWCLRQAWIKASYDKILACDSKLGGSLIQTRCAAWINYARICDQSRGSERKTTLIHRVNELSNRGRR